MATKIFYFTGIAMWAKVQKPDDKYGKYTLDLYLDPPSMDKFKESGLQLKVREGDNGTYVRFSRAEEKFIKGDTVKMGKPEVLLLDAQSGEYATFDGLIGNGSEVVCKVAVYNTEKGMGHTLEAVAVDNLVEYNGVETDGSDYPF